MARRPVRRMAGGETNPPPGLGGPALRRPPPAYHAFRRGMTEAVRVTTCRPVVSLGRAVAALVRTDRVMVARRSRSHPPPVLTDAALRIGSIFTWNCSTP